MQRHKRENIEWLNFDLLSEVLEFSHGVLLRVGGYSASSYRSLNGSYDVGDDPENVTKNRDKVCALFGLSSLIFARQCHGVEVVPVVEHSLDLPPCDGLMTNRAKCALAVLHADCQSAIFLDPKRRAFAVLHSGWRGSVSNIYGEAILRLESTYGCKREDILACIGPSLGPAEYADWRSLFPQKLWHFRKEGDIFDFWEISHFQLTQAGILPHHIEIAKMDTFENCADFFSYRRDHTTGRHITFASLMH